MSRLIAEKLAAGIIFGDVYAGEFIYMPGSEIGTEQPLCIFEKGAHKMDLPLEDAARMVEHLSLVPSQHPLLGDKTC